MLRQEWNALLYNRFLLLIIVAILMIPTIYTTLFLGSMWDPYGNLSKLPIAVVNQDQPSSYEGTTLDVGSSVVSSLSENDSLDFHFVDEATASAGLLDGTYYMVITIPDDFSSNAATLLTDHPQKMELDYATNPGTNYIASKMSESAAAKIKTSIENEVTTVYMQAITEQFANSGDGLQTAADGGAGQVSGGIDQLTGGLTQLEASTSSFPDAAAGVAALNTGFDQLSANNGTLLDAASQLKQGGTSLTDGLSRISDGSLSLQNGISSLASGVSLLSSKSTDLVNGVSTLYQGTSALVENNAALTEGAAQLANGAAQFSDGSGQLYEDSQTLSAGLTDLQDGSSTLHDALADGAAKIQSAHLNDTSVDYMVNPIDDSQVKIHDIPNNGHGMAPYMMSVALWVGALAFCLMYPLTRYQGTLSSGLAWWAGKASVLYAVAIIQAVIMIALLHFINGFTPVSLANTLLIACIASITFTSLMYFFNVLLGKAGSFLMLIFMIVQLAGSAGTYPVELSSSFVAKIHDYLPFSYTVTAFRRCISTTELSVSDLGFLFAVFGISTLCTILVFVIRTRKIKKGQPLFLDFLKEKGLA